MIIDKAKLGAAVAALLSGVFGLLTALGVTVSPDNQAAVQEIALSLSSLGAIIATFLPSLLKKKAKETDDETTG